MKKVIIILGACAAIGLILLSVYYFCFREFNGEIGPKEHFEMGDGVEFITQDKIYTISGNTGIVRFQKEKLVKLPEGTKIIIRGYTAQEKQVWPKGYNNVPEETTIVKDCLYVISFRIIGK